MLADPPGAHVKNIVDPTSARAAQRRSEGPAAGRRHATDTMDLRATQAGAAGPARHLPAGRRLRSSPARTASRAPRCRATSAAWARTGPAPARGPADASASTSCPTSTSCSPRASGCSASTAHAFDDAPFADVVRERLAAAFDAGRRRGPTGAADAAGRASGATTARWSGPAPDVVFGDVTRANPNFTLVPEAWCAGSLVEDGRRRRRRGARPADGSEHEVAGPLRRRRGRRPADAAAAVGLRRPAAGAGPVPQRPAADGLRRPAARRRARAARRQRPARRAGRSRQQSGVSWVPYTDDEPFHGQVMQLDASPVPLAERRRRSPGTIVGLGWFCAKDLQRDDRVEFDDDATSTPTACRPCGSTTGLTDADHARSRPPGGRPRAAAALGRAAGRRADHLAARRFPALPGDHADGPGRRRHLVCDADSQVWGVAGLLRRRQRRHPDLDRLQSHPHFGGARGPRGATNLRHRQGECPVRCLCTKVTIVCIKEP